MLTLKRASTHRPGGPWSDDDYDVYDGDRHIGRVMLYPQAPEGEPWFLTITARVPQYPHDQGLCGESRASDGGFQGGLGALSLRTRSVDLDQ